MYSYLFSVEVMGPTVPGRVPVPQVGCAKSPFLLYLSSLPGAGMGGTFEGDWRGLQSRLRVFMNLTYL